MALGSMDHMNFILGQSINRDGSVPACPRLEGDGREHAPRPAECGAPAAGAPNRPAPTPARTPFLEGRDRGSTDAALLERSRQRDQWPQEALARRLEEAQQRGEELRARLAAAEGEARALREERQELVSEGAVQSQVNRDLKKLLVASMGADLQAQLEHLSTERAQLGQDLESTIATLAGERETLERVGIQCDVWRSKFLGSRLQVDEAVAARTRLDMVLQEACHALRKVLEERDEMRAHMMQTHRLLHYLSTALQRSQRLAEDAKPPSNVLTLALLNQQVAASISKHLLGDVGHHAPTNPKPSQFDFVEWTSAEMLAKDILLNRQATVAADRLLPLPVSSSSSPSSSSAPSSLPTSATPTVSAAPSSMAQRFHPQTKYENLTINCCKYCLGEIQIV